MNKLDKILLTIIVLLCIVLAIVIFLLINFKNVAYNNYCLYQNASNLVKDLEDELKEERNQEIKE